MAEHDQEQAELEFGDELMEAGPASEERRSETITAESGLERREINRIVSWALTLPVPVKFELQAALREDLASALSEDNPEGRLITERKASLEVMRQVCEHLELEEGVLPTVRQFDRAVTELGMEEWSSNRLIRLWGTWRLAKSAFDGTWSAYTPANKDLRKRYMHRPYAREVDLLTGVEAWLETKPEDETRAAYDRWVKKHNQSLKGKSKRYIDGTSLRSRLPVHWTRTLAIARGELTLEEAKEQEVGELLPKDRSRALIGTSAVGKLINRSPTNVRLLAKEDKQFPTWVARIGGRRVWLYEDVLLYRRGLSPPSRSEGELQPSLMDTDELQARLLISREQMRRLIQQRRWDYIPEPEGAIADGFHYWRRELVKQWLQANQAIMKAREARQKG